MNLTDPRSCRAQVNNSHSVESAGRSKSSRLTITATDLELSIRTSCEAKIKKEGAGTIPAKNYSN